MRRGHHKKGNYPDPVRDEATGCLLWQGSISPEGYARIGKRYVHREVYEENYGPIPDGYQVDHVAARGCKHRHCVEPSHLEAVPQVENIRRQPNVIRQMNVTHCPKGHEYTEENTMIRKRGSGFKRECRRCHNDRCLARKRAKKVAW